MRRFWRRKSSVTPGRTTLLLTNCLVYLYQVLDSIRTIRGRFPEYWPVHATQIVWDSLWDPSRVSRFTSDFLMVASSSSQPHRFVTAGFLHSGLVHLAWNMFALMRSLPSWLETGLGTPLYVTTFLASIVMGNLFFLWFSPSSFTGLGASGGLTGLYGLMYVCLVGMGNTSAAGQVLKGMWYLVVYGVLASDRVSNTAHIGGFVGGVVMGILCGPSFGKSYGMRRKWSLEVDSVPREYRNVMGFGIKPSKRGLIPLYVVWVLAVAAVAAFPNLRTAPAMIWQAIVRPGSLSAGLLYG